MKFNQLKIGQPFRYQESIYTKSGPLQAVQRGGNSARIIMRSAQVEPLNEKEMESESAPSDAEQLRLALDRYHQQCREIILQSPADALQQLDRAHQALMDTLPD